MALFSLPSLTPLSHSFSCLRHGYVELVLHTHSTSSPCSLSCLFWQTILLCYTNSTNVTAMPCIWYRNEALVVINGYTVFHAATSLKAKESPGLNVRETSLQLVCFWSCTGSLAACDMVNSLMPVWPVALGPSLVWSEYLMWVGAISSSIFKC